MANKIINFAKFDGFGETIFIAEHLFNSPLISVFDFRNSDEYISINQEKINDDKLILEKGEYILQKGKKSFAKIVIK